MNKRLCVLQITPSKPNPDHVVQFSNQEECDFYFVTHDENHPDALKFCPNTTYIETKNILIDLVPKNYDYYAFVDYDYEFESKTNLSVLDQLLIDLNRFNPPLLIPFPDRNLNHPQDSVFGSDKKSFLESKQYSCFPFTHFGCKIIHHSLLDYFFPLPTDLGFAYAGCHLFNILELPFMEDLVITHNVTYSNAKTSNYNDTEEQFFMSRMWSQIRPYFKLRSFIDESLINYFDPVPRAIENFTSYTLPMQVKNFFLEVAKQNSYTPKKFPKQFNFYSKKHIERFFDLDCPFISRKNNETLVVVGNGPSLKEEHLSLFKELNVDTFALNSMYRYFEEYDWYPTYFGCFDYALHESHKANWEKLVLNDRVPIKKYFFIHSPSVESELNNTLPFFSKEVREHPKFVGRLHNQDGILWPKYGTRNNKISCTGANAIRTGIELGYKKIIMIGHEGHYKGVNYFDGQVDKHSKYRYQFTQTPEVNPNYFRNDYQQKTDLFHDPCSVIKVWNTFNKLVEDYNNLVSHPVDIVNCSPTSIIEGFRKNDLKSELGLL